MTHLFEPLNIREVTFRNRIVVSPSVSIPAKMGMPMIGIWFI